VRASTIKTGFSWIGIAAIAVQLNAVPLDYLLFRVNQDQIARTQCEHKVPHCNGHCFLAKQLTKAANAENDKRSEQVGPQLDGHFLLSAENNLTVYPSACPKRPLFSNSHILSGWPIRFLQPPRIA
jgi:hypothetical protein